MKPSETQRIALLVEDLARTLRIPPARVLSQTAETALRELLAAEVTVRTGLRAEPRPTND